MKRLYAVLAALALGLGIAVVSAPAANAYLIYAGVWDENTQATTTPTRVATHCWFVGAANGGYICEKQRGSATWPQENFTNLHNFIRISSRQINGLVGDDSWTCYNRGRPPGTVNVLYTCFQSV